MEGQSKPVCSSLPVLLAFTAIFFFSFSDALHLQNLVITSLPKPQTDLSWATQQESDFILDDSQTLLDFDTTFAVNLHHVDNLPVNLNSTTPEVLFKRRLRRDAVRAKALFAVTAAAIAPGITRSVPNFSSSVVSGLAQGSGEYFTRLGVGTPPRYAYMVLDTGSDVVWIQCLPCRKCYTQSDPIFDPRKSSSFKGISCQSPFCRQLDSPGCTSDRKKCLYEVSYGDGSFTTGEFSTETLTFRRKRVDNIAVGCGHDNQGLFIGAAGLMGLGRGKLSFPSQTGGQLGGKFSYCLVDRSATSKPSSIMFGPSAVPRNALFTPLLKNPALETFYYIGLNAISVGGARVPGITPSAFKFDVIGNGGVIVDSGTSVTRLVQPVYEALRNAFRSGASNLKRAPDFSLFDTCFNLSGKSIVKVPTVELHLHGADVSLPASNYLIPVDSAGRFCFTFAGTTSGLSIIGNIQQQGFRVVFDTVNNRIGFAPKGCV